MDHLGVDLIGAEAGQLELHHDRAVPGEAARARDEQPSPPEVLGVLAHEVGGGLVADRQVHAVSSSSPSRQLHRSPDGPS
jgi:hypothetical protein